MPTVTLLQKAYGSLPPETCEPILQSLCRGLNVKLGIVGKTDRGWIKVKVSGEDEGVALCLLEKEIGLALTSIAELKKSSVVEGRILLSDLDKDELHVDVAVSSPPALNALIPLEILQAQLADGQQLSLSQLTALFCLCDNLPVLVRVVEDLEVKGEYTEVELSETQLALISRWIRINLDRLVILGAPLSKVEGAVRASKHARDIIRIDRLGLLEHAVLCKLGTDAKGIIPKLESFLPEAALEPFSPRKIRKSVGSFKLGGAQA